VQPRSRPTRLALGYASAVQRQAGGWHSSTII